jgi:hypothetical protein
MTQSSTQAEAGGGRETAVETPSGGDSSLNTPGKEEQQSYEQRFSAASTPAEIARLTADLLEGRLAQTPPAAPAPGDSSAEAATGKEGSAETGDGAAQGDAAAGEGSAGESTGSAATGDGEAGSDDDGEKKGGKPPKDGEDGGTEEQLPERIRLTNFSKVEKLALTLKREDPKLTLAEAEVRAKAALGVKDEAPAKSGDDAAANNGLPKSVEEVDAKLTDLVAQRSKALKDLNFEMMDNVINEIDALKEHRIVLREQKARQAEEARSAYNVSFDAAEAKAGALYDFVQQAESEAFKRMAAIDDELRENKDPLFNDPEKPLIIAQMVARELRIAPKSPGRASGVAKTTTSPNKQGGAAAASAAPVAGAGKAGGKSVPPVASGSARTSSGSSQSAAIAAEIQGLKNPDDLEKFLAKLGGG